MNSTYSAVAERFEKGKLTPRQVQEFEMLQDGLADGWIDGDDFSLHWNDMFPSFNFMRLFKQTIFLVFEGFVLFLLSKNYDWPVLVSAFLALEFIGFLFIRLKKRVK